MSDNPLNKDELSIIAIIVRELENHFSPEDEAKVGMVDYNDDYIDFVVAYKDGEEESMAVERCALSSNKTIKEIVDAIQ